MRGLACAVGGLLQTGVDFPRRLVEFAPGRHDDGAASGLRSVDCTGIDRYATGGQHHDSSEQHQPGRRKPE